MYGHDAGAPPAAMFAEGMDPAKAAACTCAPVFISIITVPGG